MWQVDFTSGIEEWRNLQPVSKTPSKSTSGRGRSDSLSSFSSDEEMKRSPNNFGRIKYGVTVNPASNQVILDVLRAKVRKQTLKSYQGLHMIINFSRI